MASWNPFSSREKQVSDSNLRDMQRSEAPTGAIGRLSSKVRSMVDSIADRARNIFGGSKKAAQAGILAAAASVGANHAYAGQDFQPSQSPNGHAEKDIKVDLDGGGQLNVGVGLLQRGDNMAVFGTVTKTDDKSGVGGFVLADKNTRRLGLSFTDTIPYSNSEYANNTKYLVSGSFDQTNLSSIPAFKSNPNSDVQVESITGSIETSTDFKGSHLRIGISDTYVPSKKLGRSEENTGGYTSVKESEFVGHNKLGVFVGGELVFGKHHGIGTRTGFEKYSSDQGDSSNLYTQFDYYYADKDTHFNAFARHNIDEKQSINGTDTTRSYGNYGVRVERVLSRGVTGFVGGEYSTGKNGDGSKEGGSVNLGFRMNLGGSNKSFLSDTPPISGNVGDMMGISPRGLLNQSLNASINANPEYSRGYINERSYRLGGPKLNSYVGTTNWAKQLDLNVLDGTTGIKLVNVSVDASAGNVSIQGDKIVYTPAKKPDGSSQYNADISFDIEVDGKVYTGYKAVVVVTSPILIDITGISTDKPTIILDETKTGDEFVLTLPAGLTQDNVRIKGQPEGITIEQITSDSSEIIAQSGAKYLRLPESAVGAQVHSMSAITSRAFDAQQEVASTTIRYRIRVNSAVPQSIKDRPIYVSTGTQQKELFKLTVNTFDTLAPALTLNGAADVQLTVGDVYTELGVKALDNKDGDISSSVQMSGSVDTNTPGTYTVTYTVKDKAGNASEITRTVVVQEKQVDQAIRYTKIVGGMTDASSFVITSPGVDDPDGYIATLIYTAKNKNTGEIVVNSDGRFLNKSPGEWEVRIAGTTIHNTTGVMSSIQQSDVAIYTIETPDTLAPTLTLNGASELRLTVGDAYTELGVKALDNKDGDISSSVQMSGSVDTNTPGTYTVTYTVKDKAGNASGITRTVVVQEKPKVDAPTIYSDITGVPLSNNSFQITSSGLSDADGEITSLLYVATNTRTMQQLVSSNGRFDNLDWGDWVVIATGMAKDGATGELKSVRNDLVYRTTIAQPVAPNEGGPTISIPTVNAFAIEYDSPTGMWVSLTSLGGTGHGDQKNDITISNFGAFDPDGIASFVVTSQLFGELYRGTQIPSSIVIPESRFGGQGYFGATDEIVVTVTDNHRTDPKTTSQTVLKLGFN